MYCSREIILWLLFLAFNDEVKRKENVVVRAKSKMNVLDKAISWKRNRRQSSEDARDERIIFREIHKHIITAFPIVNSFSS